MGTNSSQNRKETAALERVLYRAGYVLIGFDDVIEQADGDDIVLTGVSIKPPHEGEEQWLVVVRAYVAGEAKVAFHSDSQFIGAIKGFVERFTNRTLKWKEDEYERGG